MCFFGGISLTLLLLAILMVFVHPKQFSVAEARRLLFSADDVFRTCYILIYILLASGVCIAVWTRYNINYMYVF
jgi:hypothetical protein